MIETNAEGYKQHSTEGEKKFDQASGDPPVITTIGSSSRSLRSLRESLRTPADG